MKRWLILGSLVLAFLLITVSCAGGGEPATNQQLAEAVSGDITVSVSGSGNIKANRDVLLSFTSSGKVAEVFVKEGDSVNRGDRLARLDTGALELARDQAEGSLLQAEVALTQAKVSEETAAHNLKETRERREALELALLKARIDVATANYNLTTTRDYYLWTDIKGAQANVDQAQRDLDYILEKLGQYIPVPVEGYTPPPGGLPDTEGYQVWQERAVHAQARLRAARDTLDAMTAGFDIQEVIIKEQQLQAAEMAEEQARKDLDELDEKIALDELRLESARQSTGQAEKSAAVAGISLAQARKRLDEATITAPFPGIVASVDVKAEESATASVPAIRLIDVSKLTLIVELDEIDVPGVKPGQTAVIEADALPDEEFGGTVAYVYPMPREVSGIVLFDVKIEIEVPSVSELRAGMTASVDIIKAMEENVLMIPIRAVFQNEEGQKAVRVWQDGQAQERVVTTGIDDGINIEITSGLQEGETVIIELRPRSTQDISFF